MKTLQRLTDSNPWRTLCGPLRPLRLIFAVIIATTACGSDALLTSSEIAQLNRAEKQWEARPFADYSYEIQQNCFCAPTFLSWVRVSVRGGAVVAVSKVEPDSAIGPDLLQSWQPIDSLFARLHADARNQGDNSAFADIVFTFDSTLGYPSYIEWKEAINVADAGAVYHLRNVQPLN